MEPDARPDTADLPAEMANAWASFEREAQNRWLRIAAGGPTVPWSELAPKLLARAAALAWAADRPTTPE